MSSLLPTDMVIKQLCIRTGEPGFHNYTTLQSFLLDSIRDLNIFSMPCWSVVTTGITPFNTFNWPCDCIKPLVTTLLRDGCHYLLEVSEDLIHTLTSDRVKDPNTPTDCSVKDLFQIDGFLEAYGWTIWSWGLGELYGANSLRPPFGLVIHDKANRRSFVKGFTLHTGDQIVMFFKSDGLSNCPEFIPAETKQVTEYFMLQKWYELRNPSIAVEMERRYKEHLFRIERLYKDGDENSWTRAMYAGVQSSPKL